MKDNIDKRSQAGLDATSAMTAQFLGPGGASVPGGIAARKDKNALPAVLPAMAAMPKAAAAEAPPPGFLSSLGTALGEQSVSGNAQFMASPFGQWLGHTFGSGPTPSPENYQTVQDEAAQAAGSAVTDAGPDWSPKRLAGYGAQMIGSLATPQGIAATAATSGLAPVIGAGVGAAGLGTVGKIAATEAANALTFGAVNRHVGDENYDREGHFTDLKTMGEQIGMDLAGGVFGFAIHGGVKLYGHAGEAGFTHWVNHISEGEKPYSVGEKTTTSTNASGGNTTPTFGRSQFGVNTHPDAWAPIVKGAGLTADEVGFLQAGAVTPEVKAKLDAYLGSAPGKAVVDGLDNGYTRQIWLGAKQALEDAGVKNADPHLIAQVADTAHTQGLRTGFDVQAKAGLDGKVTADSMANWRATQGAEHAGNAADLAKRFAKGGVMPWSKNSSTATKGISVADADAALGASKLKVAQGDPLHPAADATEHSRVAQLDADIAQKLGTDPDAAGTLMAQRRSLVDQINATTEQKLAGERAAGQARAQEIRDGHAVDAAHDAAYMEHEAALREREARKAEYDRIIAEHAAEAHAREAEFREAKFNAEKEALDAEHAAKTGTGPAMHEPKFMAEARKRGEAVAKAQEIAKKAEAKAQADREKAHAAVQAADEKVQATAAKMAQEAQKRVTDQTAALQDPQISLAQAQVGPGEVAQPGVKPGLVAPETLPARAPEAPAAPKAPPVEAVGALLPDVPQEITAALLNRAQEREFAGLKTPMPAELDAAVKALFDSQGGAEKLGSYIKWKNRLDARVMAAFESAGAAEPQAAMQAAETRIERQASAPETKAEKVAYKGQNVTILGSDVPWEEFRASGEAQHLTSEEMILAVQRRGNLPDSAMPALREAAEAAKLGAREFQGYLKLLEARLGPDVSLTLDPENYTITRQLGHMLDGLAPRLAELNLAPIPFTDREIFVRALSRYFAQEMHFDRMRPQDLKLLLRELEVYERQYAAGVLTPEQHQGMLRNFAELIDNTTIHEGLEPSEHAVYGHFNPENYTTSLNVGTMLDTAVHEFMHGFTTATPEGRELMTKLGDLLGARERAQLGDLLGAPKDNAAYVMSTEETAVRAMQAYFADPGSLTKYLPDAAELIDETIGNLPPEVQRTFSYFAAVQKATASIHARGDYRYPWLMETYGAADRPFDYARSFSITSPKAWAEAFASEKASFAEHWLRDDEWLIPHSNDAYGFIQDTFDAARLGRDLETASGHGTGDSRVLQRRGLPDPSLELNGSAAAASADTSLRNLASTETGRSLARARAWFGGINRLMSVETRSKAMEMGASGIVQHSEAHIYQSDALAQAMTRSLNASENAAISGKNGLMQQSWVKDFTRGAAANTKEALRYLVTGESRLANAADNASLSAMAKEAWERGQWHSGAEIDADGRLSASAKEAYKFITTQTQERSDALKQSFVETFLAGQPELERYRGKGWDLGALKAEKGLSREQVQALDLIDASFRPGYFPTTRQGIFRIFATKDGETIFARGAHTIKEAEAIAADMRKRFPDASVSAPKRMDEVPPLANQLDATGSTVAQVLHYLRETEHGAELTAGDFQEVLRKLQEPGALRQYFAKRSGVPGWEEEDFVGRHAEFLRRSALFEHGQTFKRGIQELLVNGEAGGALSAKAAGDVRQLYANAMNNRSKMEEFLVHAVQEVAPNAQHLRHYSQLLRKLAYNKVLGFSSLKRVALDVNHAVGVSLNEVSAEASALQKAFGTKGGWAYATRAGIRGTKDAASWLAGHGHDSEIFLAYQKAIDQGFLRVSPIEGKTAMEFFKQRKLGRPGQAALDAALEASDIIGHYSGAMREAATFSAFYRTFKELAPGMHEDALVAFAGDKTMNSLNLRAANRPTLAGMQGEVANQGLSFKAFLGNVLSKVVQNAKLAKGTFVEVPNVKWKPGSSEPRMVPLAHRDAGNMLKFLATATAMGGPLGIPAIGWAIGEWNYWTGRDETLTWKHELNEKLGGSAGRFLGAMLDKGLIAEYTGYDMSELGNLMLPTSKDGLVAAIMPAALSIVAQGMRDVYQAAAPSALGGITKPMVDPDIALLRAVSPNAYRHLVDAAQLAANRGRIYTAEGNLVGNVTPADVVKLVFAGMSPLKEDDYRKTQVDKNLRAAQDSRTKDLASGIARKITNHEALSVAELGALWSVPGVQHKVQTDLRDAQIPTYAKIWKSIAADKDPENAARRMAYFQTLWQDALDRGEESGEASANE